MSKNPVLKYQFFKIQRRQERILKELDELIREIRGSQVKPLSRKWQYLTGVVLPIMIFIVGTLFALHITSISEGELKSIVTSTKTAIETQIKNATQVQIQEIQEAIYPNSFLVGLDVMNVPNSNTGFLPPGGPYILSVEKDSIDLRLRVKNCTRYPATNITISLVLEKGATEFDPESVVNQLLGKGFWATAGPNLVEIRDDQGHVTKIDQGIRFIPGPIEAGDYTNFPFMGLSLKKEQVWIAVNVRTALYCFLIEKGTGTSKNK